ncbi:MAG TPA: L,D-transpeptidase [Pseudolabrys sp.]|nr:L,D-transpeptidase [Pseudolabrys sp.]
MQRSLFSAVIIAASISGASFAEPLTLAPEERPILAAAQAPQQGFGGGGFIEFLFSGGTSRHGELQPRSYANAPAAAQQYEPQASRDIDPRYERQEVAYSGKEAPGTIVIDTPNKFLYLVEPNGMAMRYGVGVGRPGFTWAGVHTISAKKEWPDWVPPDEMLERQPGLPHFMAGGPNNPLGARAMYLGSTLYRIHGSNEPWTIGHNVSSGCIRLRNVDVIDLYGRVKIGTKVVVL